MRIGRPRKNHRISRLAAWLGVFAVLLRCVIAPGLMPDLAAAAKGEFKLVICTASGGDTLPLAPGDGVPQPRGHESALCPYTTASHVAVAVGFAAFMGAPFDCVMAVPVCQDIGIGTPTRAPGARAPPRIA